jgi:hypothetical protein
MKMGKNTFMKNREIALWGPAALSGGGGGKGVPLANPPDPINRGVGWFILHNRYYRIT